MPEIDPVEPPAVPPSRLRSLASAAVRRAMYLRYNLVDLWDSRLAPALPARRTPLGFVLQGLRSVHHRAMQEGTFEPVEVAWISALLPQVDRFVDVGANIGYFTCLARARGRPALAVEPQPLNLKHLLANLVANGWVDTEVAPVGLAEAIGIAELHGASSTGASLLRDWAGAPSSIRTRIPVSTLDTVLGDRFAEERLLIKVDVEGLEYRVLRGAARVLARRIRPVWLLEITLEEFHPSGRNPDFVEIFELLWSVGYAAFLVTDSGPAAVTREMVVRWAGQARTDTGGINYLFVPGDGASVLRALDAMRR